MCRYITRRNTFSRRHAPFRMCSVYIEIAITRERELCVPFFYAKAYARIELYNYKLSGLVDIQIFYIASLYGVVCVSRSVLIPFFSFIIG